MKVLHVIGSLDPGGGGPPAVAVRLAAAQKQLGHDVAVVTLDQPQHDVAVRQSLAGVPGIDELTIHRLTQPGGPGGPGGPQGFMQGMTHSKLVPAVRELLKGTDIVQLHGVWEPVLRLTATEARRARVPYVVMPHGMLDPWSLQQKKWKKRIALMLGYRAMLSGAAYLHTLNDDEARLIEPMHLGVPSRIIPNGVFIDEIEPLPAPGSLGAKYAQLKGKPFVLFLSRLHYKKGLDYLADAFALLAKQNDQVQLVVAGPDGGAQRSFEQQIADAGLTQRVHVVGPLYGREKYAAMVDAVCFCLPSRQEGFSLAITEAMVCGCPVVITQACHYPQVAEVGAGEVTPLDAVAVGDALVRIVNDEAIRTRMSIAGRELVCSQFTWPRIARQAIGAYKEVCA